MSAPFRIELLGGHDRSRFNFRQADLDRYFQVQVTQDVRRHVTNCFVAIEVAREAIAGYYTLPAASIAAPDLPEDMRKRLPRYPSLPAVRIGVLPRTGIFRVGVSGAQCWLTQRRGHSRLLPPPVRSSSMPRTSMRPRSQHHGFRALETQPRTLFLPLATVAAIRRV